MPYPPAAVANAFITLAGDTGVSPMKLQKLVYFAHGWHLAINDAPLVSRHFEAWQFGPVIPELYREFKRFGSSNVDCFAKFFNPLTRKFITPQLPDTRDAAAAQAKDIASQVWNIYGAYSAIKLSNATHKEGTPWAQFYDPAKSGVIIPDPVIQEYFRSVASEK